MSAELRETQFGFEYGAVAVERMCASTRGDVFISLTTDRDCMEIRVTPGGRISVYNHERVHRPTSVGESR